MWTRLTSWWRSYWARRLRVDDQPAHVLADLNAKVAMYRAEAEAVRLRIHQDTP